MCDRLSTRSDLRYVGLHGCGHVLMKRVMYMQFFCFVLLVKFIQSSFIVY